MGVVPQLDNLDVDVTVEENLAVFARLYRVAPCPQAVDRALDLARLQRPSPDSRSPSSPAVCAADCCSPAGSFTPPSLVLLDEPTVGLDPQIRGELWTLIDGLRAAGSRS